MARSTGPIIAIGAITIFNQSILNHEDVDWRIPVATGFAAMTFSFIEKVSPTAAVGVAWIALLTVLLTRIDPKVPAPVETLLKFWNGG